MLAKACVVVLLIGSMLGANTLRRSAMDTFVDTQRYEDIYYLPPAPWLKVASLGHHAALADLIWMKSLVYFGDAYVHQGQLANIFEYGDAMATLDPNFQRVYGWVGMAALYRPVELTMDDRLRSVAFLRKGSQRFPEDEKLAWDYAAALAYEVVPYEKNKKKKRALQDEANTLMMKAARMGGGPAWLALRNATQLVKLGKMEQAAKHLEEMYLTTSDPDIRETIASRIKQLRKDSANEAFQRTITALESERKANYSYIPLELYNLIGPRIGAAGVDGLSHADTDNTSNTDTDGLQDTDSNSDHGL